MKCWNETHNGNRVRRFRRVTEFSADRSIAEAYVAQKAIELQAEIDHEGHDDYDANCVWCREEMQLSDADHADYMDSLR